MTDDELALLRTIRHHPDADLPRLVYADWLEEHNDADRAEFLRLQIERYNSLSVNPDSRGIGWREYQILQKHELAWKAELPLGFRTGATFRRGLIHRVRCRARDLFALPEHALTAPIEELMVVVDELDVEWLAARPVAFELPLRELSIRCIVPVGPYLAEALVRYGPFPKLRTLRLEDPSLGDEGFASLPRRIVPDVIHLDLRNCGLTDGLVRIAIENGWIEQLARLDISGNPFSVHAPVFLRHRCPNVVIG